MLGRFILILFLILIIIYFIYDIKINKLLYKENLSNYSETSQEYANYDRSEKPFVGVNFDEEGRSLVKFDKKYFNAIYSINLVRIGDKFAFTGEIDDEKTFFYIDLQLIHSMFLIEDSFVYLTPYYKQIESLPCSGAFAGANNPECTVVPTVFDKINVEPRKLVTILGCKNVLVQDMCPLIMDNMSVFVKSYNAESFKIGDYTFKNGAQFLAIKYAFFDKNLYLGNRFTTDKQLLNAIGLNNMKSKESIFYKLDVKSVGLQLYDLDYSGIKQEDSKIYFNPIIINESAFEIFSLNDPTSRRSIMVNSIIIDGFPHSINGSLYFSTTINYISCSEALVQALVNSFDTMNGPDFIAGRTFLKLNKSINLPIIRITTLDESLKPVTEIEIGPDIYMKEDNVTNFYNPKLIDSNYEDNQASDAYKKNIIVMGLPFFYNYLIIFNDVTKKMYRKLEYERPKFDSSRVIKEKNKKHSKLYETKDLVCYKKNLYDPKKPVNINKKDDDGIDINISYKTVFNLDKLE